MTCYTLSDCVIEGIISGEDLKQGLAGLLMAFIHNLNTAPCKLAIDKERRAIEAYLSYNNPHVSSWVEMMGLTPSSWELIDVDHAASKKNKEIFKEICSNTADRIMIVYSHNGWVRTLSDKKGTIVHNGVSLSVLDESEAIAQIFPAPHTTTISIADSVIATTGSCVSDVRIKK